MSKNKVGLAILAFLSMVAAAYLFFVDRSGRRTFEATVTLSSEPPKSGGVPLPDPPDSLTIYRTGRDGVICFETFHSPELRKMFDAKNGQRVMVKYDTFSDFGKVRAYNVHSIDGFVLANGYHVIRPEYAGASGLASGGRGPVTMSGDSCW